MACKVGANVIGLCFQAFGLLQHGTEPLRLLRAAEKALYHVKRSGKQSYAPALTD